MSYCNLATGDIMNITLDTIKAMYQFSASDLLQGEEVVRQAKCSQWTRRKEQKNEKDLVYVQLQLVYRGANSKSISYNNFHLEDSEGYFNKPMPPEDYIEKFCLPGQTAEGGVLFSLYRDTIPARIWFDTGLCYESTPDPILIDIALPLAYSETRTQFLAKEELVRYYTEEMADNLSNKMELATETLIKELSAQFGTPYKKIVNGYILRILLPGGRKQNVILNFSGKDKNNNDLVTIGTICAPASSRKNDRIFLKMNPKMSCGALGISCIHGQDYYVITETLPASAVNKEVIAYAINNIAATGDSLEDKLTGGQDIQ